MRGFDNPDNDNGDGGAGLLKAGNNKGPRCHALEASMSKLIFALRPQAEGGHGG